MAEYWKRIVINPRVMAGKPVIKGTRIPVDAILKRLADNWTPEEILKEYPNLTRVDINAALDYASRVVRNEEIVPLAREPYAVSH